jgi:hypothetical protein
MLPTARDSLDPPVLEVLRLSTPLLLAAGGMATARHANAGPGCNHVAYCSRLGSAAWREEKEREREACSSRLRERGTVLTARD